MSKRSVAIVAAGVALAALPAPARAERPWTGYIVTEPVERPPNVQAIGPGYVIYMNRNGGTFKPGQDDSRTNTSGVPVSTSTLSPLNCNDSVWQQVMTCLRDMYEPYNVKITDVDPGNAPHVESVVAGSPSQMKTQQYPQGLPAQVGGIAPLGCGLFLNNPITYSFANIYQCNAQAICETVAQETAHAFGLDHENYCPDPMTYKMGCGKKKYRDYDARCGEYSDRNCQCNNASTQNSHKMLLQIFGSGVDDPPSVDIVRPSDGAVLSPSFSIEGNASDDSGLTRVELYLDGSLVDMRTSAPFIFDAKNLSEGSHAIKLRAIDNSNKMSEDTVDVMIQAPCADNDDCPTNYVCQASSGECVPGPNMTGGLGSPCTDGSMCSSGLCAQGPDGSRCVELCTPGGSDCPNGFQCLATGGGQGACWPGEDALNPEDPAGGCGCRTGGERSAPLGFLAAFFGLAIVLRRSARR
jgi:hypothetical protein